MNSKRRTKIQGTIITILIFILLFSKNLPLLLTAYLTIAYTLVDVFNSIREQEFKNTKEGDDKNFWPQTITYIFF
jgi:hypothetical protein